MRYNINARLIYDATSGTLTLPGNDEPDSQLSITASTLFYFFLCHTGVLSREEILKKIWDDHGLTSSNSNLNQYLSMLRKTFRHYDIDNIIITVPRGHLQLNPDIVVTPLDTPATPYEDPLSVHEPGDRSITESVQWTSPTYTWSLCGYILGAGLLFIAFILLFFSFAGNYASHPINLTPISYSQCALLASDEMLLSVAGITYGKNFDTVRQRLKLECNPGERFVFFYGDRLETNGLGRVFLARCAVYEDNPFSYCDNYFYYSWKPQ